MRRISFCSLLFALVVCTTIVPAQVKISQVYGGGHNQGAPLTRDYIELYNTSSSPVTMTNWSVQYAAAASTFTTTQTFALNGTIPGNGYWLIGMAANTTATTAANAPGIPAVDTNGTQDMAATSAKIALCNTTAVLTSGTPTTTAFPALVDFVGYGTAASSANWNEPATTGAAFTSVNNAPAPSATMAVYRNTCGASDSENNKTDWNMGHPSPRNSLTPPNMGMSLIGSAIPMIVRDGQTTSLRCTPRLCGSNTLTAPTTVTVNLTSIGGGAAVPMHDDGLLGDDLAGDGLFMLDVVIPLSTAPGPLNFAVFATDGPNSGGSYIGVSVVASTGVTAAPANDNCRTATAIGGPYLTPVTTAGSLLNANVESNPLFSGIAPFATGFTARRGVWYTVAGTGGTLTADLCLTAPAFDAVMMVFCGTCDGLTIVNTSDNFCNCNATGTMPRTSWCSASGVTYYIWVAHTTAGLPPATDFMLRIADDGLGCTATTNCTTCISPPVPQTEAEAGYGPSTNDGCDVGLAGQIFPGSFTDIAAPGPVPTVINGNARNMGGFRDFDWYRFQASVSGQLTASIQGQREGYQILLNTLSATGTCPAVGIAVSPVSSPCSTAMMQATVTAGTWYGMKVIGSGTATPADTGNGSPVIVLGGDMPAASTYNYTMLMEIGGPPLADSCATPAWVSPTGTPGANSAVALGLGGDNTLATLDGNPVACGVSVDKDVWFRFRPAVSMPVWTIHTCSTTTTFDTVLEVYAGGCAGAVIACNDDDVGCGTGVQSRLDVALTPGTDYLIRVCAKGGGAAGGTFALIVVPGNDVVGRNMGLYTIPGNGGSVSGNTQSASTELLVGGQGGTSGTTTTMATCATSVIAGQRDFYYYFTPTDPCATAWQFSMCCGSEIAQDTEVIVSTLAPTSVTNNSIVCADDACAAPSNTLNSFGMTSALTVGTPYIVRVLTWSATGATGPFTLNVTPIGGGANDNCANAQNLAFPAVINGSTVCGVSNDGLATCDLSAAAGLDVWYKFTLAGTGNVHLDTCGSAVDTTLAVYTGVCGSLTEIACNDEADGCACTAPNSAMDLIGLAAGTYTIRLSTKTIGGSYTLRASTLTNDNCCSAIPVACGSATPGTTVGATAEVGLPVGCIGPQAPGVGQSFTYTNSVWYTLTAPPTGGTMYADTLATNYDSKIFVWTGTCGALQCVTANDDITGLPFQSKVAWKANPNQQYFLMVGPFSTTTGNFTLTTSCAPTPANDDCSTPIALGPQEIGSIAGTTVGATCSEVYTATTAFPSCASSGTAPLAIGGIFDVWYSYTACGNANVTFNTCGSFNTLLSVHTACPGLAGPNNQLGGACNNDGAVGCAPGSSVTVAVTTGTNYLIRVAGAIGATTEGNFTLGWVADGPKWYQDNDSDGFGNPLVSVVNCVQPSGFVISNLDCNDNNNAINPSATEVCDGIDNDCDSLTDDADPSITGQLTWYQDFDGDTYGNLAVTQLKCVQPSGYVSNSLDCDDSNGAINPAGTEVCDGLDNDCDTLIDDADPTVTGQTTWYQDFDGDTYGNSSITSVACAQPTGYVANNTDCNDTNSAVNPAAVEICNNIDDDCDSIIDEACPPNDDCTGATAIADGTFAGDNSNAGSEIGDLTCGAVTNDVWYSYTNTKTCTWTVTVSLCPVDGGGAAYDAVLHAFNACGGALIACDDNFCGTNPKMTFSLAGGATALIAVSAVAPGPGGNFSMVVSHTSASTTQLGPGCSDGGGPGPTLSIDAAPVICSNRVLSITGAAPSAAGMMMFSFPGTPTGLAGGCPLYLNQGSLTLLLFIGTDPFGNWSAFIQVPCDPLLECATFTVQAILFPNSPPPFYQVTSGLSVTLGL